MDQDGYVSPHEAFNYATSIVISSDSPNFAEKNGRRLVPAHCYDRQTALVDGWVTARVGSILANPRS